jgi:hypothetical protein
MSASATDAAKNAGRRRFFRRAQWERITTGLIFAGLFMLMQPFSLALYTYSFIVILAGTFGFAIATKLPE